MTPLTLDASVLCNWYLDPAPEPDVAAAQTIAVALRDGISEAEATKVSEHGFWLLVDGTAPI